MPPLRAPYLAPQIDETVPPSTPSDFVASSSARNHLARTERARAGTANRVHERAGKEAPQAGSPAAMTGLDVVELRGVENVLAIMGKNRRNSRNDPGRTGSTHIDDRGMEGLVTIWTRWNRDWRALAPIPGEAS
jgi:hypothetical protein